MTDKRHAFGPYVFDAERSSLKRDGSPVALGHIALTLLAALLEAKGEIASRAQLMDAAWRGAIVEEANLTVQIGILRKALGTAQDGADWIATVPRQGYRLRVRDQTSASVATDAGRRRWLAVLPFQNMTGDPAQEHLADGIVEDITTMLSRKKTLAVVARNSSFAYKGRAVDMRVIGAELGAEYLLEGSVRRIGERLRLTTQLIDARNGAHLWARNFDTLEGRCFWRAGPDCRTGGFADRPANPTGGD